jgi:biotin carboxylase
MDRVAGYSGEKSRRLLVLGAGPAQIGLLEATRAHGIWTAVCDRDPSAPGFAFADRRCIVSTDDEPAIERLASALQLDGVIAPGSSRPVAVAARIAEKLGVPHPISPATAMLATHKLRQREALADAGVPQPRWQIVTEGAGEVELALPVVVKAPDRAGRQGLTLVRDETGLPGAIAAARSASRGGLVLVEEYVDGPEVTVSGFSAAGELVPLAVTDRIGADEAAFGISLAQIWPSSYAEAAVEVARRAVEAIGIAEGPSHTRLRVSRGGPEVISVAARLAGGHDAELVEVTAGIDLNGLALAAALGEPLVASELTVSRQAAIGGAATRFLVAPAGVLESVEVPQGLNGVITTRIYRERGYDFAPLESGWDPAGTVLAVGATREAAVARVEAAVEQIRFFTADAHVPDVPILA